MIPEPDLVVRSPTVSDSSLETGESFSLSVTVGNDGAGNAAWRPLLSYYRSTDGTITTSDTEEGDERTDEEKEIGALFAGQTRLHQITLTAPSAAGTYYYGACVSGYASLEIGRDEQLLGIRGSRRIELAGQPGSGAATSHRMHGSRRARVDAGSGSMGIRGLGDAAVSHTSPVRAGWLGLLTSYREQQRRVDHARTPDQSGDRRSGRGCRVLPNEEREQRPVSARNGTE